MSGLLAKFMELMIRYAVVPLFSQLIVAIVNYFQEKKEKAERDEKIDNAVKEFKDAKSNEEKEAAFLNLVRSRSK